MFIRKKNFNKLVEQKAKEMLDNDSYVQIRVANRKESLNFEIKYYKNQQKELDKIISKFVKLTEVVPAGMEMSKKFVVEYTPLESIDDTIKLVWAKMECKIHEQFDDVLSSKD